MKLEPFVYRGIMLYWYDGDSPTIDIDLGFDIWMRNQKVRLYGVDTPELRGEEREDGIYVRDIVREWCQPGSEILIRTHKDQKGKYGRWLAEIQPEGWIETVNARLWRDGHAEIEAYSDYEHARIKALFSER